MSPEPKVDRSTESPVLVGAGGYGSRDVNNLRCGTTRVPSAQTWWNVRERVTLPSHRDRVGTPLSEFPWYR